MQKFLLNCTLLASLLGLTGCQDTINQVENADKSMVVNTIADRRVVTDSFLRNRLKIVYINTSVNSNGFLTAQIKALNTRTGFFTEMWGTVRNFVKNEEYYKVDYRFRWLDQNGMAVDSLLSSWQQIPIKPGETVFIQGTAPRKDCRDFLIEKKEAD